VIKSARRPYAVVSGPGSLSIIPKPGRQSLLNWTYELVPEMQKRGESEEIN
jgi:hypothetical protein